MIEPDEREFTDALGVPITYWVWEAPAPRGVIQLAHGVGEHARRYDRTSRALVDAGWSVWADDHRGHGVTGRRQWAGDTSRLGRLGPGGLRATMEAVHAFSEVIRAQHPSLPLVYLGHSWGSLMGQLVVDRHSEEYAAAVFTGTAYRMPGWMNSGDLNRRHRHLGDTGLEWLSRDTAIAAAFVADPLTTATPLMRLFGVRDAMRLVGRPARRLAHDLPMLIMVGGDDPLGGARSAERLARAYRDRAGLTDVSVRVYADDRHEILNELDQDDVRADLIGWLEGHVPAPRTQS